MRRFTKMFTSPKSARNRIAEMHVAQAEARREVSYFAYL